MNRYQFEDLISEYIENKLSLEGRKEFEAYANNNQELKELVDEIRNNILSLKKMKKVKTSHRFTSTLEKRIKSENKKLTNQPASPYVIPLINLSPARTGIMSALIIAIIIVGISLLPSLSLLTNNSSLVANSEINPRSSSVAKLVNQAVVESAILDSNAVDTVNTNNKNFKFNSKIQLVKDRR